jgi:lysozyme
MTNAISAQGLALIQSHEGFRAEAAQLPDGNWVVGYSHVRADAGEPVNQAEAADLLTIDVAPFEKLVNERVGQPLTQAQFDALVSFAFSVGAEAFAQSQVLRRVNTGDYMAAAYAMEAWRKSDVNGELEVVDALVRRRAAEKALFLQDVKVEATPSVFVRAKLDHAASILGAPVRYAAAPAVGSIAVHQPKADNVVVLTQILKSEPATEALLLTQVVANDFEEEGEIVTAHAKPVARDVAEETKAEESAAETKPFPFFKGNPNNKIPFIAPEMQVDRRLRNMRRRHQRAWLKLPEVDFSVSVENLGLITLLVFGLALIAVGGSLLIGSSFDMVSLAAAGALATPGLAATLMAGFGLRRRPQHADA